MRRHSFVVVIGSALFGFAGLACAADMKNMQDMNMSKPAMDQAQGVGIIKAVDPQAGTVTIAHEPIKTFDWPSMIMKFRVADSALLKGIAVGNKVQFTLQGKDMMKSTVTALKIIH